MDKHIIVYDTETDGTDCKTANPIQLAAVAVDGLRLEIIPNSEFYSWIKPDNIDVPNYVEQNKSTLDFHCRNYKLSMDDLMAKIRNAPSEKQVWASWKEYISKYHSKPSSQNIFSAPRFCGYNVDAFDFPILERLCAKYGDVDKNGNQKMWLGRDTIDIMKIVIYWLQFVREVKSYNMDTVREYFELPAGQAHDALFDVQQEALMLIKFLKLSKKFAPQIKFKGSCNPKGNSNAEA